MFFFNPEFMEVTGLQQQSILTLGRVLPCCIISFDKCLSYFTNIFFTLETSDTCSFLQILYIQTFYRNQHFVVDIQG